MSNPLADLVQPAARPVRMTILGEAGTGKTTLACAPSQSSCVAI